MKEDHMFVVPAPGDGPNGVLLVRDPEHGYEPLPPEGRLVPRSAYWMLQLRDESVRQADQPAAAAPRAKPAPRPKAATPKATE